MMDRDRPRVNIIGLQVDPVSGVDDAVARVRELIGKPRGNYVCLANVHMCVEARDCTEFRASVNDAGLVIADGRPLSLLQRWSGARTARQVRGEHLFVALCEAAADKGIRVGLYGGKPSTLDLLQLSLKERCPGLDIAYAYSPPFRELMPSECDKVFSDVIESGVSVLFVGLGCPKQERWMAANSHRTPAVMLGVGAAFDFIAGEKPSAPVWMRSLCLEWLFRLICEPRRLWRRYATSNPRFLWFVLQSFFRKGTT